MYKHLTKRIIILLQICLLIQSIYSQDEAITSTQKQQQQQKDAEERGTCKPKLNVHTINIKGCKPKTIQNFECSGECYSTWQALAVVGEHQNHCTACLPSKKVNRIIFIDCYDKKPKIPVTVTMSISCSCQTISCGGRGFYPIESSNRKWLKWQNNNKKIKKHFNKFIIHWICVCVFFLYICILFLKVKWSIF